MMMQNVSKIDWKDYTESIPALRPNQSPS
jgi:xanthine/uracil/vitamin C permease (AzgA family)